MGMPCSICSDCCCHPGELLWAATATQGRQGRHCPGSRGSEPLPPMAAELFSCSGLWQSGSLFVFLTTATLRPMLHNAQTIDKSFLSSAG